MLQPRFVQLKNDKLEEDVPGLNTAFPYTSMRVEMDKYVGAKFATWHWHQAVEFFIVVREGVRYHLEDGVYEFREGEGGFINANVLHMTTPMAFGAGAMHDVQIMDHRFIAGSVGSIMESRYVEPVIRCEGLKLFKFTPEDPRHREILKELEQAGEAEEAGGFGYEFEVRSHISRAWRLFAALTQDIWKADAGQASQDSHRIKAMITYINGHYADKIGLPEIAGAASISEREALRCFQRCVRTTPYEFLSRRRIQEAADRLAGSEDPITLVSERCGFATNSYFSKVFKDKMGMTPREYRKEHDRMARME